MRGQTNKQATRSTRNVVPRTPVLPQERKFQPLDLAAAALPKANRSGSATSRGQEAQEAGAAPGHTVSHRCPIATQDSVAACRSRHRLICAQGPAPTSIAGPHGPAWESAFCRTGEQQDGCPVSPAPDTEAPLSRCWYVRVCSSPQTPEGPSTLGFTFS